MILAALGVNECRPIPYAYRLGVDIWCVTCRRGMHRDITIHRELDTHMTLSALGMSGCHALFCMPIDLQRIYAVLHMVANLVA